jgi:hypothetical protein
MRNREIATATGILLTDAMLLFSSACGGGGETGDPCVLKYIRASDPDTTTTITVGHGDVFREVVNFGDGNTSIVDKRCEDGETKSVKGAIPPIHTIELDGERRIIDHQ